MKRFRFRSDPLKALLMLLPSLILLAVFVYLFIGRTVYVSLTDWGSDPAQALSLTPVIEFVGWRNYVDLFTGPLQARFRQDLVNTFFFTVFFLVGCLGLGLGLAVLLDQRIRFEGFFRTVFLYPFALAFIVTGTVWRWMFQPTGGVNVLPELVGLPRFDFLWMSSRRQILQFDWQNVVFWFSLLVLIVLVVLVLTTWRDSQRSVRRVGIVAASWAIFTVGVSWRIDALPYAETHGFNLALVGIVIAAVWQMSGYTMALYLAGLRGVPEELREAARVDGASELQIYRHVVMPLLAPITLSAMIILGHISLKIFDLIFAMAGPDNAATSVPALLMYLRSFRANRFAEGAAIAVVLLVLVAAVIVPYLWTQLRSEPRR